MPDGSIVLQWTGTDSRPRRIRLEPRAAGGWTRIEQRWSGEEWITTGREIVADVELEAPSAIVSDRLAGLETQRGP